MNNLEITAYKAFVAHRKAFDEITFAANKRTPRLYSLI